MIFSILIPVYNTEKYLCECLESILRQEIKSYEIILVNDGSTDKSGEICDLYKKKYPNIIKVIHKKNEGCLCARRDAIQLAEGDYLLFCDSDDYYTDKAFTILRELIDRHLPDIILFNLDLVNDKGIYSRLNQEKLFADEEIITDKRKIYNNLLSAKFICSSMSMKCVKREYGWRDRTYEQFRGLNYGEDLLQSLEIYTLANKIVYCDKAVYCYRTGRGMTGKFSYKFYEDFKSIFEEIKKYDEKWNLPDFHNQLNYFYLYLVYSTVRQLARTSIRKDEAIEYLNLLQRENYFQTAYNEFFLREKSKCDLKIKVTLWLLKHNQVKILHFLIVTVRKKG